MKRRKFNYAFDRNQI